MSRVLEWISGFWVMNKGENLFCGLDKIFIITYFIEFIRGGLLLGCYCGGGWCVIMVLWHNAIVILGR